MKIDYEIIQEILQTKSALGTDEVTKLCDAIRVEAASRQVPRETRPRKPFVLLVSDPDGVIPEGTELTGWAIQVEEDKGILTIPESLQTIAQNFNASPKGVKMPATTIADVFDTASGKLFTEEGISRKNRMPVFVLTTNNKIIKDDGKV